MEISAILPAMGAWVASNPGEVVDKASEVMRLLRDLVQCDAFSLHAWDPITRGTRHHAIASDGYTDDVLLHLNEVFVTSNPAFALAHRTVRALRWRDYESDWNLDFAETFSAKAFLVPAGFNEGITMCLRQPSGRYTGLVNLNWYSDAAATNERREIIERFRPVLAPLCDLLSVPLFLARALVPNAFALMISPEPLAHHLPGRPAGPHLGEGGALRRLLLENVRHGMPPRFLWADKDGCCHHVEIMPCGSGVTVVTEELSMWPYGLTFREIQVLHLIPSGASNIEIAKQLFVSTRTVSTHIEHILMKMGCSSRARLAAMAVAEGILLAEHPSRQSRPITKAPYGRTNSTDFVSMFRLLHQVG